MHIDLIAECERRLKIKLFSGEGLIGPGYMYLTTEIMILKR